MSIRFKSRTRKLKQRYRAGAVLLAALVLGSSAFAASPKNYWHASGGRIVDSNGNAVRISGVNWYGFETTDAVAHGLYTQDYRAILHTIKNLGYNTIRLPFSNQMVESPAIPQNIGYSSNNGPINTPLKGLNSLQVMDAIVGSAAADGLKVILDNHRSEAGNSAEGSGLWYTSAYPESNWIADWQKMVSRYSGVVDANGNPAVIGVDLRNEPHLSIYGNNTGSCWTGDSSVGGCPASNAAQNWPAAAARAGNAVLAINPNLLVFVEGVDCYNGDCDFWGGNLEGAGSYPVALSNPGQLVYSAHDYGPHEYQQNWFNSNTTPASLDAVWTKFWGYLCIKGIAPVWVGEFGTTNNAADAESNVAGSEGQWFSNLVSFLANHPSINWTYWALNGEDSYGLLDFNYDPVPPSSIKQQLLSSIQFTSGGKPPACSAVPPQPAAPSVVTLSSTSLHVLWAPVTAPANCTATYTLIRSTSSSFASGQTVILGSGLSGTGFSWTDKGLSPSTAYYYKVQAADAYGSSAASSPGSGTTAAAGSGASTCHVTYSIANQWSTGFQASITITNTGSAPITAWVLKFNFPGNQTISSLWNATYVQSGEAMTVNNASYDGSIPAGGTSEAVGFTATYSGANANPSVFSVNGTICQ